MTPAYPVRPSTVSSIGSTWIRFPYLMSGQAWILFNNTHTHTNSPMLWYFAEIIHISQIKINYPQDMKHKNALLYFALYDQIYTKSTISTLSFRPEGKTEMRRNGKYCYYLSIMVNLIQFLKLKKT